MYMYMYMYECCLFPPLCSIIMFVAFWAESSLHNAITSEASKIVTFTNSSFIEDNAGTVAVDIVDTVVLIIEGKRYMQEYIRGRRREYRTTEKPFCSLLAYQFMTVTTLVHIELEHAHT